MVLLMPRDSAAIISCFAKYVQINEANAKILGKRIADAVNDGKLSVANFSQNHHHPKCTDPIAIDWIFVVDTLNFCFWKQEGQPGWTVDGYTGYFALCAAINRAVKENYDITNPKYYSTISKEDLQHILRSDNDAIIPLFDERLKSLHEVGSILLEKYGGTFVNCVKEANNKAMTLLKLVVNNFECFKDEAIYMMHQVTFYKRAQILIADIWACFQNKDLGYFVDINELTMFADYRVPQTLLHFNVLQYDEELTQLLKSNVLLPNGSKQEVEIRGCSIEAVDQIQMTAKKLIHPGKSINAILVDHFLWDYRRAHAQEILEEDLPFHKTLCIYY